MSQPANIKQHLSITIGKTQHRTLVNLLFDECSSFHVQTIKKLTIGAGTLSFIHQFISEWSYCSARRPNPTMEDLKTFQLHRFCRRTNIEFLVSCKTKSSPNQLVFVWFVWSPWDTHNRNPFAPRTPAYHSVCMVSRGSIGFLIIGSLHLLMHFHLQMNA